MHANAYSFPQANFLLHQDLILGYYTVICNKLQFLHLCG